MEAKKHNKNNLYMNETEVRYYLDKLISNLGFKRRFIELAKTLKVGRSHIEADYILSVNNKPKIVIEAKSSSENVLKRDHIYQANQYATHPDVKAIYFIIANNKKLAIFNTKDRGYNPINSFDISCYDENIEILDNRWEELLGSISYNSFLQREKEIPKTSSIIKEQRKQQKKIIPIKQSIEPRKKQSPIHSGTHPYFTKRAWNIVREYINNFTNEGDYVLDPFGGSGVTAIEAMLIKRIGIHSDINPIANFMTEALAAPVCLIKLQKEFENVLKKSKKDNNLYWYPKDVKLPANSDRKYIHELFEKRQLRELSVLLKYIKEIRDKDIKKVLFLLFSATIVKTNICYVGQYDKNQRPKSCDASFLKYFRFWVPPKSFKRWYPYEVFEKKFKGFYRAKEEIKRFSITNKIFKKLLKIKDCSATNLEFLKEESIDYIFTDPPYGEKITYLDLSIIWNSWLGFNVPDKLRKLEVIEGGSLKKSEEEYIELMHKSIDEIYRVLKKDCWLSIVFASDKPSHWHAVYDYCTQKGFSYVNTVCQYIKSNTAVKNQNPLTVFKGELILNFKKTKDINKLKTVKTNDPLNFILNHIELCIVQNSGKATIEQINNSLIPKLWESGLLSYFKREESSINEFLSRNFVQSGNSWSLKKHIKLGHHIPLKDRMKFYLISSLNKAKNENRLITIDDIVMETLPNLRNGKTPKNQEIIKTLREIAYTPDGKHWEIVTSEQLSLGKI